MIAVVCALLSGAAFYTSFGLGEQWALAWIAPIPVLWLAFGEAPRWRVHFSAIAAYAIGGANILAAYAGEMPLLIVLLAILGPALLFCLAVRGARMAFLRFGASAGILTFAALWSGLDFLMSFSRAGGSALTPAASQVGAPILAQAAALFGFPAVTFLLGAVSAALAIALRTRHFAPCIFALVMFAANAGFGYWHMSSPPSGVMRVGLIATNVDGGHMIDDDRAAAVHTVSAYADQIARMDGASVDFIVLPEGIARIGPAWREAALAPLTRAAAASGATVVAGFSDELDGAQRNVAWLVPPDHPPLVYAKRRLVLGNETARFTPGAAPFRPFNGIGLQICKDMDFGGMVRADVSRDHPAILAVPAWDFGADRWAHARIAILRSIENGVPVARAARDGLLTLNDSHGRLIAIRPVAAGFTSLTGDIPLHGPSGQTLYARIGDVFGWLCVILGASLAVSANARRRSLTEQS